jgi:cell wall-associated NlpC family hydrolase
MNETQKRQIVLDVARRNWGKFYTWGGDDPSSFDCSGLVIECLKSVGVLARGGDWTAAQLWKMFSENQVVIPDSGDLVFWENSNHKVVHVEIVLNRELSLGASGGGSFVRTVDDAIKYNAFVKIRPITSRAGVRGYVNPY